MVIEKGQRFTLRDGQQTLGTGVITNVLPKMDLKERETLIRGRTKKQKEALRLRFEELCKDYEKKLEEEKLLSK